MKLPRRYRPLMRAMQALAGLLSVMAVAVYGYSMTIDISQTTSNRNLVQTWAVLFMLAGMAVAMVAVGAVCARRYRNSK